MSKSHLLFLLAAILLGWMPSISLWLDPPPLMGDEAYYARVPIEMRERRDWVVPYFNGEPRYKKPPLMYWLVAFSQAVFGENEFASRLPSFAAVILTSLLLGWFGFKIGAAEIGAWAATAFLLNPMTSILGNWGAPEATLCFFVTASVIFGFLWLSNSDNLLWLLFSGVAAGLGVLTKGAPGLVLPIAVLFPLTIWKSLKKREEEAGWTVPKRNVSQLGLWLIACFIVSAPWFIAVGLREGEKFWQVFLLREHIQRVAEPMEGHRGPIWFYLPVIWLLFMPWSVCLPHAFTNAAKSFRQPSNVSHNLIDSMMAWWALSVVVLFSLV
ncbi:MAG: glycosyltransferase family 39 protein, partial [Armatimonadetes bacterium]|nr:glycosyltransferase family 39 protein [Armatimonadota bacterium]